MQFTAVVFLRFKRRLLRQSKPNVFLIVDEHPLHTLAPLTRSIQRHPTRLPPFFLTGRSPGLNLDEILN